MTSFVIVCKDAEKGRDIVSLLHNARLYVKPVGDNPLYIICPALSPYRTPWYTSCPMTLSNAIINLVANKFVNPSIYEIYNLISAYATR
jgi:hypothetical protein